MRSDVPRVLQQLLWAQLSKLKGFFTLCYSSGRKFPYIPNFAISQHLENVDEAKTDELYLEDDKEESSEELEMQSGSEEDDNSDEELGNHDDSEDDEELKFDEVGTKSNSENQQRFYYLITYIYTVFKPLQFQGRPEYSSNLTHLSAICDPSHIQPLLSGDILRI